LQENYENIPPEERRMYEAYLRTNSSLTDPLLKLYGTRELIIQNLQIIDKIRQDLQQIKEALEELEKTPAEARQADFSAQKEQLMQKKNELETSLDTEEALVRRLQKTFEQSNNEVDRKLQSTIDRLNADYQKEGALEGTSWLMDKVSGIWETSIKGNAYQFMGYDEKDLRYRYEVPDPNNPGKTILHPVFLAIENKLYYYLDAEGKRVLLPAPEQRRLREADQNDALSRRVENINETLSDVKNVGRNLLNGEFSKAAKKGIEALDSLPAIVFDKTASEIASDAVDLASDAASSLYNEALSIFAPTEDTPAATNKFEKAAGTAPVPTSQPIPAPTNTGPGSP
ncbi:MAG TPA: hypothetical protein PLO23_03470, partial [Alphaproteobacteria bacterium]|nr:hypothetical protein [Alphaproteobacteria bacterium]